jgi:hypothetical protein
MQSDGEREEEDVCVRMRLGRQCCPFKLLLVPRWGKVK